MKISNSLKILILTAFTAILACISALTLKNQYENALFSVLDPFDQPRQFTVSSGWSFGQTMRELEKQNFIKNHYMLKVFARLNETHTNIKAGDYLFSAAMSTIDIINAMHAGKVITYSITFPEGMTIAEMAEKWDSSGHGSKEAFVKAVTNYTDPVLHRPSSGWEGYLFPETYVFSKGFDETQLIQSMINQLKSVLKKEWVAAAREHDLNFHQVVTLASLIEKETRIPSERPIVSAVFHNRLKKGMLLQCDPTVVYALGESYSGRLLKKHLAFDSPHNTYVYAGLPPGPIGSPGKDSLESACFPADSSFLYFVADGHGGHVFSNSLSEHNQAVQRYRNWLRVQKTSS